ncbi:hypothetical protein B0T16DRAFT_455417 [Cercophora newfieldiana]|uniref:Uncharacterized protein n=1 Tax=Cercophora newfieldiana TaxID=92897 RepID=A0AA40CXQ8_9PEZI|nr:hypothetical protein B0T16DRAFT_455417 [Cercophora newfieldiana]
MMPSWSSILLAASMAIGTMAAPAAELEANAINVNTTGLGDDFNVNAFSAQMDLWNGNKNCGGNDWTGIGRPDGVCYGLNTKSLWVRSLNTGRGCRFVRVFSEGGCKGGSADLGDTKRCWDVSTRKSFQIYC